MNSYPLLFFREGKDLEPGKYRDFLEKEDSHWWWKTRRSHINERLVKQNLLSPQAKVLDIGCGAGGELELIKGKVGFAVGVDNSPYAIEASRERGLKHLSLASGNALPFKDRIFDLVTANDVLYHREIKETNFFKEVLRVLKPGGRVLITVAALDILWGREDITSHGARRYTKKGLAKLAKDAGFEVIEIKYLFFTIFPPVLVFRLLSRAYRCIFKAKTKDIGTDVFKVPDLVNTALIALHKPEVILSKYLSFPAGSSLICLLKKPQPLRNKDEKNICR